ncbi:MAG TPA: peptidylprolyl isomerase, partial [Prevotellaceae bacterium]|nr:peptidylprolyl isomerase [Prevotellaceae bacterium]
MNRKYFLALVLFMGVFIGLVSCSETNDDNEEYPDWQKKNTEYFQNIFSQALADIAQNGENSQWDTIRCWSLNDTVARLNPTDYIVVHKIKNGGGSGCP